MSVVESRSVRGLMIWPWTHVQTHRWTNLKFQLCQDGLKWGSPALKLNQQLIEIASPAEHLHPGTGPLHTRYMHVPFTLHYQMQIVFQLTSTLFTQYDDE